MSRSTGWHQP